MAEGELRPPSERHFTLTILKERLSSRQVAGLIAAGGGYHPHRSRVTQRYVGCCDGILALGAHPERPRRVLGVRAARWRQRVQSVDRLPNVGCQSEELEVREDEESRMTLRLDTESYDTGKTG